VDGLVTEVKAFVNTTLVIFVLYWFFYGQQRGMTYTPWCTLRISLIFYLLQDQPNIIIKAIYYSIKLAF